MLTDVSIVSYLIRVSLALAVLSLCAFVLVRYGKKRRHGVRDVRAAELLASLPVGRDVFFVVRCGPDVVAFVSGTGGARFMGRWKYEEWIRSAACEDVSERIEG